MTGYPPLLQVGQGGGLYLNNACARVFRTTFSANRAGCGGAIAAVNNHWDDHFCRVGQPPFARTSLDVYQSAFSGSTTPLGQCLLIGAIQRLRLTILPSTIENHRRQLANGLVTVLNPEENR